MCVNPREVKPRVEQVKPAGDSTPERTDAVEGLGFGPPVTKSMVETCYA